MNNAASKLYNDSLTVSDLARQEALDSCALHLLTYEKPASTCEGFESGKLANMNSSFPHTVLGHLWKSTEYLYLCGEWSNDTAEHLAIQQDVLTATSGYAAKRYKKSKHKKKIRPDFTSFRHDWMLWCVWQKCLHSKDFAALLRSIPDDVVIVEVVKRDPVWAAYPDPSTDSGPAQGIIRGGNAMGKILTICRRHLIEGTEPAINRQLLNDAGIYILGSRVVF